MKGNPIYHAILRSFLSVALAVFPLLATAQKTGAEKPTASLRFRVTLDPAIQSKAYSGRVYVMLSDLSDYEPRLAAGNWFFPPRLFVQDVRNLEPGGSVVIGPESLSYPVPLPEVPPGCYKAQAVARRSLDHPIPGQGPGDLYSVARKVTLDPARPETIEMRLDQVVSAIPFEETERVRLVELVSPLLSKFHGRLVKLRASVVLPTGYRNDSEARYPVLYFIPGFAGDHWVAHRIVSGRSESALANRVLSRSLCLCGFRQQRALGRGACARADPAG